MEGLFAEIKGKPIARILSMGAGVQTTACLLKYHKYYDYVVFADTGDELPETYSYMELYLKPYCKKMNIPWITARTHLADSLYEYSMNRGETPYLKQRTCTRRFKIEPINRFLRSIGASKERPVIVDIGFSTDEARRLNSSKYANEWEIKNYPLLADKLSRQDCKDLISKAGYPLPHKSGCFYCGFQTVKEFKWLKYEHPKLFLKAVTLEKNAKGYPKHTMRENLKLEDINKHDSSLDSFTDQCDSGHCFL